MPVILQRDGGLMRLPRANTTDSMPWKVHPTITGATADHHLPLKASQIESFARALAQALKLTVAAGEPSASQAIPAQWVSALAKDLQAHPGTSLVIAGDHQPPVVHALVHAINDTLKNVGKTVIYTAPVVANPVNQTESLRELVTAMTAGKVELLLILGGNPVFYAPVDLNFGAAWRRSKRVFTWASMPTKPRRSVNGKFPKRIISKPGAMHAPTMARLRSSNL